MRNIIQKSNKAFSLIELLITIAIVGILTSIGYPTYKNYITRTRRSKATVTLARVAARMEFYYNQHHSYQGATFKLLNIKSTSTYYEFALTNVSQHTFTAIAIPQNTQAQNDTACGTISLNQLGAKTITGNASLASCYG